MIELRKAEASDLDLYFSWANDPDVRHNALNSAPIPLEIHEAWFRRRINSPACRLYVIENDGKPVGQVRFDVEVGRANIDYSIARPYRGRGLARRALQRAVAAFLGDPAMSGLEIAGVVKVENVASSRIFRALGFDETSYGVGLRLFRLPAERFAVRFVVLCSKPANYTRVLEYLSDKMGLQAIFISRKDDLTESMLRAIRPEFLFFIHWSSIIPPPVFKSFRCVVFHMTDLPFGRGGSPLQNLIVRGFKNTVICALAVEEGLDTGPVYARTDLSLEGSAREIYERAGMKMAEMIEKIIHERPQPVPQQGVAVEFRRRKREEGDIGPLKEIKEVYDYVRMLDADGYPPAFIETDCFRFEFSQARLLEDGIEAHVRILKK